MQCLQRTLQNYNSAVMETKLSALCFGCSGCGCELTFKSLKINSFLEFVSNPSSSFRSFLLASRATTFLVSDFCYQFKAIRLRAMFVFVFSSVLLWLFMLLLFLWPDTDIICRVSNTLLSSIVMVGLTIIASAYSWQAEFALMSR